MKTKTQLPPKMHLSNGRYYFVHRNKWHPLGRDLASSLETYAKLIRQNSGASNSNLETHVEKYLKIVEGTLAIQTFKNYKYCAKNFLKVFQQFLSLTEIKPKNLNTWREKFREDGKQPSWNLHHSFLSGFFKKAVGLGWDDLEMNPMAAISKFKVESRTRLITNDELDRIYQHSTGIMRAAIMIADQIGQRVADIRLLKKKDISDEGIFVAQRKSGGKRKVLIKMTPELREAIEAAKQLCPLESSEYLFHHTQTLRKKDAGPGRPYGASTWCGYWSDACEKAGVEDAHFHDIRARVATTKDKEGGSAKELLGHAYQQTTDIYLRGFEVKEVEPVRRKTPKSEG